MTPLRVTDRAKASGADARFILMVGPGETSRESTKASSPVTMLGEVSPNPASVASSLSFTLGVPSEVRVTLYDALGRRVATPFAGPLTEGPHRLEIPVPDLAPGAYVVLVEGVGERSVRRLTVTR